MNPDVAITFILGGEVALLGIAGGIATWYAARPSKDSASAETLNRVLAADDLPRIARPQPRSIYSSGAARDAICSPGRLKWIER